MHCQMSFPVLMPPAATMRGGSFKPSSATALECRGIKVQGGGGGGECKGGQCKRITGGIRVQRA